MRRSISLVLRRLVAQRADDRCEYCRVHQEDSFLRFHIDHVVAVKHGGTNAPENLALACSQCNHHKGSDLSTTLTSNKDIAILYNPREDAWEAHFFVRDGSLHSNTRAGLATIKLLQINDPDRVLQRALLQAAGRWP
jgi:hypothetical protein